MFDSVKRDVLMVALEQLGMESKLRRLVKMTMSQSRVSIMTRKVEAEEFIISKGGGFSIHSKTDREASWSGATLKMECFSPLYIYLKKIAVFQVILH